MGTSRYSGRVRWRSGKRKSKSNRQGLPKKAPEIEVKIDSISCGGDGVSLASWKENEQEKLVEIYVPNTLPGEVVRIRPTNKIGKRLEANL